MRNSLNDIEELAKLLSGYDDITWNKLKERRKATYRRAAATVLLSWDKIKEFVERL